MNSLLNSFRDVLESGASADSSSESSNSGSISSILQERGKTHGSFDDNSTISLALKCVIRSTPNYLAMTDPAKEALDMISHKIGRILAGNPNFKDHWADIAGYAQLVADRCPE